MTAIHHPAAKAIVSAAISVVIVGLKAATAALAAHPKWTELDTLTVLMAVLAPLAVYAQPNSPLPPAVTSPAPPETTAA